MRRPSRRASWLATSSSEGAFALSPTVSRRAEHILSQLKSELPGGVQQILSRERRGHEKGESGVCVGGEAAHTNPTPHLFPMQDELLRKPRDRLPLTSWPGCAKIRAWEEHMLAKLVKAISDFLAKSPGLLVVIGLGMIILNFVLQLLPPWPVIHWMAQTNLWLHLGLLIGLFGLLVARVL